MTKFPLKMAIPAIRASEPGLVLPKGQWRKNEDGSMEVVFNSADELYVCLQATKSIRNYISLIHNNVYVDK